MELLPKLFLIFLLDSLYYFPMKAYNLHGTETAEGSSLKLVHVLFRHGIRTPDITYKTDPYTEESFHPFGWGQLTSDGKRDLYEMGQWLHKRYKKFLDYYNAEAIYARSTATSRTLMSMATVLAGMFPPNDTPMEWKYNLNWQPIPIFSEPLENDTTLRMQTNCAAYDVMKSNVTFVQSPDGLFEQLSALTGENVTSASDVNSIYIGLWIEELFGLKLPQRLRKYFPRKMRFMAEQSYMDLVATDEMQRIKAGPFLEMLIKNMLAKVAGTSETAQKKLLLYCGHDWTITNILIALQVWKRQMPNFAALILFELHQNPQSLEYYVELYFQNGPRSSVEPLTLPGCSFQCPLAKVVDLLQHILPTGTYEEMCKI